MNKNNGRIASPPPPHTKKELIIKIYAPKNGTNENYKFSQKIRPHEASSTEK